ncbi:serine hydrolase domain-containing protein [Hymenobacter arizonensis]|nr:serine hydrolase domain-containing protein [Hymenobacter arizonensis]
MLKYLASLFLLTFLCLPCAAQTPSADRLVDEFVARQMKTLKIPGLAVAVIKNGKQVKATAYGQANVEWNRPVTVHSNFQIASCTKLLTSTLIMKTIYAGKLRLEDPIGKYIDSVPARWQNIQVKHLLSHSSGIRDYHGNAYLPTAQVVKALMDSTQEYTPGTKQHYAQADFMVAGYILEKIYNKPFTQILKEQVTGPLNMNDGAFDMEQRLGAFMRTNLISQKATTYYDLDGQLRAYKYIYPQYTYTAGGYFASLHDMVNWAIGLDKEVLFPQSFSKSLIYGQDSVGRELSEFSRVGWALGEEKTVLSAGHSGGPGLGDVWRFPDQGYTIIVLSNDGELLPDFARAIASFYVKGIEPKVKINKFER